MAVRKQRAAKIPCSAKPARVPAHLLGRMSARSQAECEYEPAGYDAFARIYSQTMAEDFARRALPAVRRLLLGNLPAGAYVLDACCGSGQFARALLELGFRVTGMDSSESMLLLARSTAPSAQFICADVRRFALPALFDATICTFNSLAHVNDADALRAAFNNIRAALRPEGRLLFDLTMEDGYVRRWRGQFELMSDGHLCIVRPSYNAARQLARNDVTIVAVSGASAGKNSWQFTIWQKCHTENDVRHALHAGGFTRVESFDAELDLAMAGEFGRRFFLCSAG